MSVWGRHKMVVFFLKSCVQTRLTGEILFIQSDFRLFVSNKQKTHLLGLRDVYFTCKLIYLELLFIQKNPWGQKSTLGETREIYPQKRVKWLPRDLKMLVMGRYSPWMGEEREMQKTADKSRATETMKQIADCSLVNVDCPLKKKVRPSNTQVYNLNLFMGKLF